MEADSQTLIDFSPILLSLKAGIRPFGLTYVTETKGKRKRKSLATAPPHFNFYIF